MAQPIPKNACCSKHIILSDDIKQVGDMIDDYDDKDGKSNAQNRYTLYSESCSFAGSP